ncbi:MAG: helix-turn-helix transcriptional regulator [Planctomycetes bacterium]|nr:helix-turn-helix transcriptional regulator [Planctomycetota bacterium]
MPVLDPDLLHVRIVHSGRSSLWPWWRLRGASNPGWVIYANDRDGARISVGNRAYPLRAGRVLVIPPETRYDSATAPDVHQVYYHVELLGLPAAATGALLSAPLDLGADPVLAAQAERLHALLPDQRRPAPPAKDQPPASMPLLALAFVHQVFARLLDCSPRASRIAWADRLRAHGPLANALRHIDDHLAETHYVAALAARCAMGPHWFTTRFRTVIGQTPAQYIIDRRIVAAALRLSYGDDAIDDIARDCGFTDRSHFSRLFTRRRGIAPAAYRARERRSHGR